MTTKEELEQQPDETVRQLEEAARQHEEALRETNPWLFNENNPRQTGHDTMPTIEELVTDAEEAARQEAAVWEQLREADRQHNKGNL